jgi:CheY-like chemotaxis protein
VRSEPGKGSVFTLTFPAAAAAGEPLQMSEGLSKFYQAHDPLPELKRSAANGKIILVVEDSEPAIVQLSWILKDQGYQVEVARDGFEALAAMKMKIPDAIILDLMMPGMDGFEVLERMRGTRETASIPVLILTAMYLSPAELKRLTENHIHQLVQKGDVNKNDLLSMVRKMLFPHEMAEQGVLAVKAPRAKISAPATILIIDDNADNVTTLKVLLQDKNSVVTVTDGRDGVDRARSLKPDLIMLDISLPGMDGFKVFDEIRREEILRHIPVIAVTAKAMKGDREQILLHGFDDYISKPVEPEVFEETIGKWIL